jgi:hypothetical protein
MSSSSHKTDTPFGRPAIVHDGDLSAEYNALETIAEDLEERVKELEGACNRAEALIAKAEYLEALYQLRAALATKQEAET